MSEVEQLRRFARDFLTFASRAERGGRTNVAPSDAFEGSLGEQWGELLRRAKKLTAAENLPN